MINIDRRIFAVDNLSSPNDLKKSLNISSLISERISSYRKCVEDILVSKDDRLLAIVGPCSIHDYKSAIEYAKQLKEISDQVKDTMFIVMRTYFEKPRTIKGWKGLIVDPNLDGTYDIEKGLYMARHILLEIASIGLPVGCEILDPIVPQYIDELMSWSSIGARTTESQTHRTIASGISVPIGFKNGTNGDINIAVNAIESASEPASFIGIDRDGKVAIMRTTGNEFGHLILRGGYKPNYSEKEIDDAMLLMMEHSLSPSILIDLSHANSQKNPEKQVNILRQIVDQRLKGQDSIKGFMMESFLNTGCQKIQSKENLKYGVSITDPCLGIKETREALLEIDKLIKKEKGL